MLACSCAMLPPPPSPLSQNGAIRFRAEDEASYSTPELSAIGIERMRRADGVQAPVLFRIPLLANALIGFGCCTPATKKDMHKLFKNKIDFGELGTGRGGHPFHPTAASWGAERARLACHRRR